MNHDLRTDATSIGTARNAAHPNGTRRFFGDPNEENRVGALGEVIFARALGLEVDRTVRPDGDHGVDFRVTINHRVITIDVKTARKPIYLLVKERDLRTGADIYVLARHDGDGITCLGWETRSIMSLMPVRDFGYGIRSHCRPLRDLRPMPQLLNLLAMRERPITPTAQEAPHHE